MTTNKSINEQLNDMNESRMIEQDAGRSMSTIGESCLNFVSEAFCEDKTQNSAIKSFVFAANSQVKWIDQSFSKAQRDLAEMATLPENEININRLRGLQSWIRDLTLRSTEWDAFLEGLQQLHEARTGERVDVSPKPKGDAVTVSSVRAELEEIAAFRKATLKARR